MDKSHQTKGLIPQPIHPPNKISTKYVENFYDSTGLAWEEDYYNLFTKSFLTDYVFKKLRNIPSNSHILNAGSGGTIYDIPGTLYHLDITKKLIQNLPNHKVGTIEKIPYDDCFFDYIICVGTVINYAESVKKALKEFSRVLKPKGILILEYERSHSGLIEKKYRNISRFIFVHQYLEKTHKNYLYSDKYINYFLIKSGFKTKSQIKFQSIVPLIAQFTDNESIMERYIHFDMYIRKIPLLNALSHNKILLCQKK